MSRRNTGQNNKYVKDYIQVFLNLLFNIFITDQLYLSSTFTKIIKREMEKLGKERQTFTVGLTKSLEVYNRIV